jgi:hypothetical protein
MQISKIHIENYSNEKYIVEGGKESMYITEIGDKIREILK